MKLQLGELRGAELKLANLMLARSGQSLAHIRACELKLALHIYDIGTFKPILLVEGGNLPLFSNMHNAHERQNFTKSSGFFSMLGHSSPGSILPLS